jgi:hypothetical protein
LSCDWFTRCGLSGRKSRPVGPCRQPEACL